MSSIPTTHTPPPWTSTRLSDGSYQIHQPGRPVAIAIVRAARMPAAEAQANARIITASPKMLAALRLVWNSIDQINHPAAQAVRTAIVEAESGVRKRP